MLVDSSGYAAGSTVTGAIRQALGATGTSFNYLLATAQVESGLNPQAGATTSSARGLFQFIDQTWLGTIKQSGEIGTSFNYLLATAQVESGLNPQAGATTSSARGLFQFIDQTWLGTIKQSG